MSDLQKLFPKTKEPITFVPVQEPWTIYRLEDGTIIRARLMLVKVIETGKILENGQPERQCQFQQIMDVEPPETPDAAA